MWRRCLICRKGRDLYRKFLETPFPRAFVLSETSVTVTSGGFDPLGRGLTMCRNHPAPCGAYAVDDRVVWTAPAASTHERSYVVTVKPDQTTSLDFSYRLNPDCSPRAFADFKVVQPPKHGEVDIGQKDDFPRFQANSPLAVCNQHPVRGIGVSYTPAKGFMGEDTFTFAETGTGNVFKMVVTVR